MNSTYETNNIIKIKTRHNYIINKDVQNRKSFGAIKFIQICETRSDVFELEVSSNNELIEAVTNFYFHLMVLVGDFQAKYLKARLKELLRANFLQHLVVRFFSGNFVFQINKKFTVLKIACIVAELNTYPEFKNLNPLLIYINLWLHNDNYIHQ